MDKTRKAIVTGSFDPITRGHVEIIRRAARLFDALYVVALTNETKKYRFTPEERFEMLRLATAAFPCVTVDIYDGMTADYMHMHALTTIVRGIRNEEDLAYEKKLALGMKGFDPAFETVFFVAEGSFAEISSSSVREAILEREDLSALLPPEVERYVKQHFF